MKLTLQSRQRQRTRATHALLFFCVNSRSKDRSKGVARLLAKRAIERRSRRLALQLSRHVGQHLVHVCRVRLCVEQRAHVLQRTPWWPLLPHLLFCRAPSCTVCFLYTDLQNDTRDR
jgi:hypothetical protein